MSLQRKLFLLLALNTAVVIGLAIFGVRGLNNIAATQAALANISSAKTNHQTGDMMHDA